MAEKVSTSDVIAFRLAAHGLTERLDEERSLDAVGRCGIQDSPPGSALLALHARVRGVSPELMASMVDDRSLLQTWCMRGAPYFVPTVDLPVFTTGVLPPTEEAMRHFILGVKQSVDRLGVSVVDAVELCGAEIGPVLAGRRLAIKELGAELGQRIGRRLPARQRQIWDEDGPHAEGQSLGEAVVHFCVRILTLQRVVCFAPRERSKAPFVLLDEWLDEPIPDPDPQVARAELLRRYLHCYGPSTRADFAAWMGIRSGDAEPWWGLITDELAKVEFGGAAWILADDLDALRASPEPKGVRLLPPRDPYTQMRDRGTIVDKHHHREVWKTVGEPGAVLTDGTIAGIWRPSKSGRRLTLTITTFSPLPTRHKDALLDEGERLAPLRGASSVDITFNTC